MSRGRDVVDRPARRHRTGPPWATEELDDELVQEGETTIPADVSPEYERGESHHDPHTGLIPDPSRLRLDVLLQELLDRAGELIENERRVHRLLDAVVSITTALELPDLFDRVVRWCCDLVGARYGAFGVLGSDRTLVDLHCIGVTEGQRRLIGQLPSGKGILGILFNSEGPLRIADLAALPETWGFPEHHPKMTSFLGVPIRVHDQMFGAIYLANKRDGTGEKSDAEGQFNEVDEEIVVAIAATAGLAIEKAQLYDGSQRREGWLSASRDITSPVLRGTTSEEAMALVAERARKTSGATVAAVALGHEDDAALVVEAAAGEYADRLRGKILRPDRPPIGRTLSTGEPYAHAGPLAEAELDLPFENAVVLVLPLTLSPDRPGTLILVRDDARVPFDETDQEMAERFADHAALALRYVRSQAELRRLAVLEDRDRIARDLHDQVIQRMFSIGLGLEGVVRRLHNRDLADRIRAYIGDVDETIHQLRKAIFSLHDDTSGRRGMRRMLLDLADEYSDSLEHEPLLTFEGPLDSLVPDPVRDEGLTALREALSNVVRHAHATSVEVRVAVDHGVLTLEVIDDGIGISPELRHRSGLLNLQTRAESLGGSLVLEALDPVGTRVVWRAPIRPPDSYD